MQQIAERMARWEWLILLAFLPLLLFATRTNGFILLLFPVLAVVRKLANGRFFPNTPLNLPLLFLLLMTIVSLLITFDVDVSLPLVSRIIVGVGLFWGCFGSMEQSETAVWGMSGVVLLLGVGLTTLGLLTVPWRLLFPPLAQILAVLPQQLMDILLGAVGQTNPNILAQTLVLFLPLLLAFGVWGSALLGKFNRFRLVQPAILLGGLIGLGLLVLTRSRGGLLGIMVAMLLMLSLGTRWGKWLFGTAVFVLPATILGYAPFRTLLFASTPDSFNVSSRLEIWSRAIYAISDFPLTGLSMNGFGKVVHLLYPLFTISPANPVDHAHNQLLQAGLDFGFLGLIAYLAIWLLLVWFLWDSWRLGKNGRFRPLLLGLIGSHSAMWMFGLFDAAPWITLPGFLWWLLLALAAALFARLQNGNEPRPIR